MYTWVLSNLVICIIPEFVWTTYKLVVEVRSMSESILFFFLLCIIFDSRHYLVQSTNDHSERHYVIFFFSGCMLPQSFQRITSCLLQLLPIKTVYLLRNTIVCPLQPGILLPKTPVFMITMDKSTNSHAPIRDNAVFAEMTNVSDIHGSSDNHGSIVTFRNSEIRVCTLLC